MTIQTRGMPMEQILEQFGEEFTITGKRLGQYIGHFPMCDVDEIDEDHIHLESWNAKTEFLNLMKLQN